MTTIHHINGRFLHKPPGPAEPSATSAMRINCGSSWRLTTTRFRCWPHSEPTTTHCAGSLLKRSGDFTGTTWARSTCSAT